MSLSDHHSAIQKLYIAYFNRPADPAGLDYWAVQIELAGGHALAIANAFSASAEYTELYGGKSSTEVVTAIYQNLFGRAPEIDGLLYWSLRLDNGVFNIGNIVYSVMLGAQGSDAEVIANKVTAATAFTTNLDTSAEILAYSGSNAISIARQFLSTVTADASTATLNGDATSTILKLLPPPNEPDAPLVFSASKAASTVSFTNAGSAISVTEAAGEYTFVSTGGVSGTVKVAGPFSGINVSSGTTLSISTTLASSHTFPGTGTIKFTDTGSISATILNTFDSNISGLVTSTTITGIEGAAADLKIALDANTAATTLKLTSLDTVTFTDAASAAILDDVVLANSTTIALADVASNALTLVDATVASGKTLTIDATALTGSNFLNFNAKADTNGTFIITGGAGDDLFEGGAKADTYTGGAGADRVTFSIANASTYSNLDTITDYHTSGADIIWFIGTSTTMSNLNTVQDMTAQTSLLDAVNAMASMSTTAGGISIFVWGGDSYVYVEGSTSVAGSADATTYTATDPLIKLTGIPFAIGDSLAGSGIDGL